MQTVSNPARAWRWALAIFVFWIILLAIAYWYFLVKPKQWFDAEMRQPPLLSEPVQQQAIRDILQQRFPLLTSGRSWFVRVKQSDCGCERFVELYHKSFAARADKDRIQVVTLDLSESGLSVDQQTLVHRLIPATPSVVLLNPQGQIVYFGPYHQEGICSPDNSYLEPVLAALQQGQSLSVLNTLVYGCFCPTH